MPTSKGKSKEPATTMSAISANPAEDDSTPSATFATSERDSEISLLRQELAELRASIEEMKEAQLRGPTRTIQREESDVTMEEVDTAGPVRETLDFEEERRSRSESPSRKRTRRAHSQESDSTSATAKELTKQLMQLIPKYDGAGDAQKLMEFIEAFEEFITFNKDLSSIQLLALAIGKLAGDAKMWWREQNFAPEGDRITTWDALKKALIVTYAPPENSESIRDKLRTLRQTGTVKEYNSAFRRLTMQLTDLSFPEAKYTYLLGLSPRLRELVKTKGSISDIRTLQNTCLSLETDKSRLPRQGEAHNVTKSPSHSKSSPAKPSRNNSFKSKFRPCPLCDKMGHSARNCWRLKDAKAAIQSSSSKSSSGPQANSTTVSTHANITIIDSGASQHMFRSSNEFSDLNPKSTTVLCANDSEIDSTHVGTVNLELHDDDDDENANLTLRDVLLVPDLRHNLLSVRALNREGLDVSFRRDGTVLIADQDDISYEIGRAVGDLYQLTTPKAYTTSKKPESHVLWHHRLGHPNNRVLNTLSRHVIGIDKIEFSSLICEGCIYAKSHRQAFPKTAENRADQLLERVHSDLLGPFPVPSLIGSRYILTLIDDASRYAFVRFLEHKSDTFQTFQQFKVYVEKSVGQPIKILRSDGGGEYVSYEMANFLRSCGIKHEMSTPHTPQQNGVAERYNRSLQETVRALMISAGIPTNLWAEIAATAAYLRNRLPTRTNQGRTPFELWRGKKPNLSHLRVIWCDAYAHIIKRQSKLSPRAIKLKLIGYDEQRKAYRLWDLTKERIVINRDVIFDETAVIARSPVFFNENNDDIEYEVEAIIGERNVDGKTQYLVKWVGYDDDESNTWEPLEHVAETKALDEWEERRERHAYFADVATHATEPNSYRDAISSIDAPRWREAIQVELDALNKNRTWEFVDRKSLPLDRQPIGCRWIFKRKLNPDGSISRYKARLVAKGYAQQEGIDYSETFAPVAKLSSIRVILTIGAIYDLVIHQMDVKSAFLNGDLEEEIFMTVPEGINVPGDVICRLLRSLYGLKQAPRMWNKRLDEFLIKEGFSRLEADHSIYIRRTSTCMIIISVHVDDLLLLTDSEESMMRIKGALSTEFEMSDCGPIHFYLGIQVHHHRQRRIVSLNQTHFIDQILRRFGFEDAKPVTTPLDISVKLTQTQDNESPADQTLFRQILGSVMYLMLGTRPDLAAAISIISQFAAHPSSTHLQAAKRILRYLKGTKDLQLYLGSTDDQDQGHGKNIKLYGYSDADWGGDISTRKSTSGYVFYASGGVVSWSSKKQSSVALSSTEAEYMALTQAAKEAIWLRRLLDELGFRAQEPPSPTLIYEDNQSATALAKNPVYHSRTKHIDIQHHFIRDKVEAREIELEYMSTENMVADVMTKALPRPRFAALIELMNLRL